VTNDTWAVDANLPCRKDAYKVGQGTPNQTCTRRKQRPGSDHRHV
jgi:hypothetical protein